MLADTPRAARLNGGLSSTNTNVKGMNGGKK